MQVNSFALVCLICQPVLLASGAICMRMMRKMPETTASFYQNIALFVIAGVFMLFEGTSFLFMWHFSLVSWLTITLSALFTILTYTTKATALKYHKASSLQKLAFVPNVFQFIIDLLIL